MPVDPFSFSSFGSVHSTKPGPIKESGTLDTLVVNLSSTPGTSMALWSGVANTSPHVETHLGGIPEGKKLLIFSITAANANGNTADGQCQVATMNVSGNTGEGSSSYEFNPFIYSTKATGPFMISLELPLEFVGPCDVWAYQAVNGSSGNSVNNYSTFNYLIVDADNLGNT